MMRPYTTYSELRNTTLIKTIMLNYLTIKGNQSGPHLSITAGVHGDEYEPMEISRRIYQKVKRMQDKLNGNLTIIPVVNKSAFELRSRMGGDDLDLARVCPGNEEGSVTEQIAYAVSKLIRTADYYLDMHTGGHLYNKSQQIILKYQVSIVFSLLGKILWPVL